MPGVCVDMARITLSVVTVFTVLIVVVYSASRKKLRINQWGTQQTLLLMQAY